MSPLHYMTNVGNTSVLLPFLSLTGTLFPVRQTMEREVRAGVSGIGIWFTGNRGEPFDIATTLDCVSKSAADTAFGVYVATVGNTRDLWYGGTKWGTVLVHDVSLTRIDNIAAAVGGIQNFTGGSGALLAVNWKLETV